MFDIIIDPPISGFDGTNILLACLAGHLTIFAFGYTQINSEVGKVFLFSYFCNIPTQITLIKAKSDIIYFKSPIIVLSVQFSKIGEIQNCY